MLDAVVPVLVVLLCIRSVIILRQKSALKGQLMLSLPLEVRSLEIDGFRNQSFPEQLLAVSPLSMVAVLPNACNPRFASSLSNSFMQYLVCAAG